jgi:hypothetical protein
MSARVKETVSLFDVIEGRAKTPVRLVWTAEGEWMRFTREECLFEGQLLTSRPQQQELASNRYVLTKSGLVKFKVGLWVEIGVEV